MAEQRRSCWRLDDRQFRVGRSALVVLFVLAWLLGGCRSEKTRVYRVGVLSGMSFAANVTVGFKAGMAELGYVEGQNILYDVQETEFDISAYRRILEKFVADRVDLILVFPTEATIEAKSITQGTNIPVVFSYVALEGVELLNSLREPGGNITGVRYPAPDIAVKRFEFLRAMAPQAGRMWIPYQRGYPTVKDQMDALRPVATAANVTLIEFPADDVAELENELNTRAQQQDLGFDAILLISEPLAVTPAKFAVLGKFAYEHGIPIGGPAMEVEGYASLFGVSSSPYDSGKLAAPIADKIFRGMPAGTIPVVSPEHFVRINYKAAQALGLTVPESLLAQADEIVR